jgi:hypothetical protein
MAASVNDVHIHHTDRGVRVNLGKLYLYPDGHANLTFPPTSDAAEINVPLADELELVEQLLSLVRLMKREARNR